MMRFVGSSLALAMLFTAAMFTPAVAKEGMKIGYVDFQRILDQSKRGQQAKEMLAKEHEFRANRLKRTEESLMTRLGEFENKRTVLSPEAFQREQTSLLSEREQFGRQVQEFQERLFQKEQELTQDIFEDMQAMLKDLAEKEGFALILEKQQSGLLYAPAKYDLTHRVLQLLDAGSGGKGKDAGKK
jgi:outer membrane protein